MHIELLPYAENYIDYKNLNELLAASWSQEDYNGNT